MNVLLDKHIDLDLVKEQLDQMVKVVTSLNRRLVPANEIIRKISKGGHSDRLTKAFTQLGRLIKTEYILRYLTEPELRLKVQRQLKKENIDMPYLDGSFLLTMADFKLETMKKL